MSFKQDYLKEALINLSSMHVLVQLLKFPNMFSTFHIRLETLGHIVN